jgi:hypothetical protein
MARKKQQERARKMRSSGMSYHQIATALNLPLPKVRKMCTASGLFGGRRKGACKVPLDKFYELVALGVRPKDICKSLDISKTSYHRYIRDMVGTQSGVSPRDVAQAIVDAREAQRKSKAKGT